MPAPPGTAPSDEERVQLSPGCPSDNLSGVPSILAVASSLRGKSVIATPQRLRWVSRPPADLRSGIFLAMTSRLHAQLAVFTSVNGRGEMFIALKGARLWLAVSAMLLSASPAVAGTVTATNCSAAATQAAINAAADGDTVAIPAGTCNWAGTTVTIPSTKNLVLNGAGVDLTTVTSTPGTPAIQLGDSAVGSRSRF